MADPNINFKLTTTGDTTGADEVKKSILAVEDAGKTAQRQADVDAVKNKQAIAIQKEQALALREIADGQQRIIAAGLAKTIGDIAREYKGLGPEVELAIESGQKFLEVFAATGNPIAAAMAVAVTAIGSVVTAYTDSAKKAKEIAKQEQEDIKRFSEMRRDLAAQLRAENLTAFFQNELNVLDKQEAAMKRIYQIRASERELAAAQQQAGGATAVAGGASQEAVAAQNFAAGLQSKIQALTDSIAVSNASVAKLESDATILEGKAKQLQENSPAQIEAAESAIVARDKADEAKLDQDAFTQATLNQIQAVAIEGKSKLEDFAAQGLDVVSTAAAKQLETLQAEVDRLGKNASSGAKEAIKTLVKVLEDGVIKPDEMGKITEVLSRVRGSRELSDKAVFEAFGGLQKADEAVIKQIAPLTANVDKLLQGLETLSAAQRARDLKVEFLVNDLEALGRRLQSPSSPF